MRIEYLYLENFVCIAAGLKKNNVTLDLRENDLPINVFIGGIGSGKTFIMSHLQPFATLGSLDIRNQDDPIMEGMDGLKIIEYSDDSGSKYEIRHEYIWSEKNSSHSTKSYIMKDGEELNPTGNVSSFKYMIKTEFGMEQSHLRLLRLGDNVTGLLGLSATERKTYIASMLEQAEFILALNKKFREDLRNINAQVNVLTNKLTQIGLNNEDQYKSELEDRREDLETIDQVIKEKEAEINRHMAEIALIAPKGYEYFMNELKILIAEYDKKRTERDNLHNELMSLSEEKTVSDIAKEIGSTETRIQSNEEKILISSTDYERYTVALSQIESKIATLLSDDHVQTIKATYETLKTQLEEDWESIKDFKCEYTSMFIKSLINDLHTVDVLINDISQYDSNVVKKLYMSDASVVSWARNQGEILTGRKINLGKKLNNLSYSASYVPVGVMYTPPLCPTENCPFKKTHPFTLSDGKSTKEINTEVEEIRAEIDRVDKELYVLAEYPTIYTKLESVKGKFKEMVPILRKLGCLLTENVLHILTRIDKQRWYSYDALVDIQERCILKENYYESLEKLRLMKLELDSYEIENLSTMQAKRDEYQISVAREVENIAQCNEENKQLNARLSELYKLYDAMLNKASKEQELQELNHTLDLMSNDLRTKAKNADLIAPYEMVNESLRGEIRALSIEREGLLSKINRLTATINDLEFTRNQMNEILVDQKYMTLMVDATSSKEGIPLELINHFLGGCKDLVNDLVFDIFEEDIALEDFVIGEKDFLIPYTVNGKYIEDVTKASQGQKSLFNIAIAFSFILMVQLPYNIALLDEVDGPLHKTEHMKFLTMVVKLMKKINSKQIFLTTHNTALERFPVNYIATTEEDINLDNGSTMIKLYE